MGDAYIDSLSKIVTKPDFPPAVIDILAEFDEALGHDNEEAIVDRLDAISEADAEGLAQKTIELMRELDAAMTRTE